jgi:putative membrane protein insertion efficiency factor
MAMPGPTYLQRVLMALVRGYRYFLSPWLGSACRFEPTCSAYALAALERHGAAAGSYLALHRLGRCHPWCAGGLDPVPDEPPRPFRHRSVAPIAPTPSSTHQRPAP